MTVPAFRRRALSPRGIRAKVLPQADSSLGIEPEQVLHSRNAKEDIRTLIARLESLQDRQAVVAHLIKLARQGVTPGASDRLNDALDELELPAEEEASNGEGDHVAQGTPPTRYRWWGAATPPSTFDCQSARSAHRAGDRLGQGRPPRFQSGHGDPER